MAARHDFTIDQGSDFSLTGKYKDEDGVAINLTGYSIASKARGNKEGLSEFEFTCTILDQTTNTGEFTISLSSATSSALDISGNDRFFYDVEITLSGVVTRILEGVATISREVTR